jgi:hypothetical protein
MSSPATGFLVVPGSSEVAEITIEPDAGGSLLSGLYAALDVSSVERILLSDGIALWVDEEALMRRDPEANLHLTNVLLAFGLSGQTLLGRGLFLSNSDGEAVSLSASQRAIIENASEQALRM